MWALLQYHWVFEIHMVQNGWTMLFAQWVCCWDFIRWNVRRNNGRLERQIFITVTNLLQNVLFSEFCPEQLHNSDLIGDLALNALFVAESFEKCCKLCQEVESCHQFIWFSYERCLLKRKTPFGPLTLNGYHSGSIEKENMYMLSGKVALKWKILCRFNMSRCFILQRMVALILLKRH